MSITLRHPAAANGIPLALAFVTISTLTFVVFRMPLVAGVGLAAVCVLLLGLRFPTITLYLYAAATFFSYVPLLERFKVSVSACAGAIFLLAVGVQAATAHRVPKTRSSIDRWLLYFMIACFLAALLNPRELLTNPRGLITFSSLVLTTMAAASLLTNEDTVARLGQVLIAGAVGIAALTCYQSLSGDYNSVGLFTSNADRAYGLADPNYTAAILVTLLPLLYAQLVLSKRLFSKFAITAGLLLALTGIGMTASRGGFLGMVLTGVICLLIVRSPGRSRIRLRVVVRQVGFAVLLLGAFTIALTASPNSLWTRLSTLQDQQKVDREPRLRVWALYSKEWLRSPLFGYGPGYKDPQVAENRIYIPHSTPLELMLETGGIGFLAYVGLSVGTIYELWRARGIFRRAANFRMHAFSGALIAAFIGFNFTGLFLNRDDDKQLWLLFGMAIAVVALSRRCVIRQPSIRMG